MPVIVALGDSTTAGTPGFRSPVEAPPGGEGDVRSQYAYWLEQAHPDWRVLNRGVNGERTDEIAARFDRDVLPHSPALVIIIAGVNDVYQGRSIEDTTRHLRPMYDRAAAAGIPVIAGSIVPYNTATPDQNARMRAINAWIRAEADRDANLTFADTRAAVASPEDPDRLAGSPDELHPDVDGYRRMAEALAPAAAAALAGRHRTASMSKTTTVRLDQALAMGPPASGSLAVSIFSHGSLEAELYTPKGRDLQQPHDRDEVYVVVRGKGLFVDGSERRTVEEGSFIFVAAGEPHRFEEFSPDFAVWVFFYGPKGGETGGGPGG